jgi:LAO/AO transport system kinase
MVYDLQSALEMKSEKIEWEVPVIATQAINNINMDSLYEALNRHRTYLTSSGLLMKKRSQQLRKKIEQVLLRRIQRDLEKSVLADGKLDEIVERILQGEDDPYSAGTALYQEFKLGS